MCDSDPTRYVSIALAAIGPILGRQLRLAELVLLKLVPAQDNLPERGYGVLSVFPKSLAIFRVAPPPAKAA